MARQKPPAPVFKIDFEDAGQLFTTWYVRNRAVIDCEPCLPRTWVGTRVVRPAVAGEKPHIMTRDKKYITLDCPVVAVTELQIVGTHPFSTQRMAAGLAAHLITMVVFVAMIPVRFMSIAVSATS